MKYKHDWRGSYEQLHCHRCGETAHCGCDQLDTNRIIEFFNRTIARVDCPIPPGAELESPLNSYNRQQKFDFGCLQK